MSKDIKIPGVGRLSFGSPIHHESSGFGVGALHRDVFGGERPQGHLMAVVMGPDGKPKAAGRVMSRSALFWNNIRWGALEIDLGTGLVTDVGALAMANEYAWANPGSTVNTILGLSNFHATGTGATAAAVTDKKLQTWDSIAAVAGTQSLVASGTVPAYRTVATISYAGTESVTEWGLHTSGTLSATTGTPFTATTATSATVTGTPYTASSASLAGEQFQVVFPGTTASWGMILSNSTSVLTIPAWYSNTTDGAGSTPGTTEAFTLRPVMWDHKVFTSIGVSSGDSIQFTYTVTVNSGG